MDRASYLSGKDTAEQHSAFWKYTLIPVLRQFEQIIETHFFIRLKTKERGVFDLWDIPELQESEDAQSRRDIAEINAGIKTINDVLKERGKELKPWGDVWHKPKSLHEIKQTEELKMKGGTLVVSRAVKNHEFYRKRFTELGFPDVTLTALEKDALHSLIRTTKPKRVIMGARFYQCATPYMMGQMKRAFPKIAFSAVSIGEYPAELAMYFIINGMKVYATSFEGLDEWYKGLEDIRLGMEYCAPAVQQRLDERTEKPDPARKMSDTLIEVTRELCKGWYDQEIADNLHVSRRTVTTHKTAIYTTLNVRKTVELIGTALNLEIIHPDELQFRHEDFIVNPLPDNKKGKRSSDDY
jgi:DNA-binding NarL/FixJ family response regulator